MHSQSNQQATGRLDPVPTSEIQREINELAGILDEIDSQLSRHGELIAPVRTPLPCSPPGSNGQGVPPDDMLSPVGDNLRRIRRKAAALLVKAQELNEGIAV